MLPSGNRAMFGASQAHSVTVFQLQLDARIYLEGDMNILKYKDYEGTAELDMTRRICRGKLPVH